MRDLPRQTLSSVAGVLVFVLTALAQDAACAGDGAAHSPFGILEREGFTPVTRLGTAEHEALFTPPEEATADTSGPAQQSGTPVDDVVFAGPALPADQEVVAGPASTLFPPPLITATVDAVVFGPPSGDADLGSTPDRPAAAAAPSTPEASSGAALLPAPPAEEAARRKARARDLLAEGSVAPARALLEDAASRGDAEGEYLLAQTYDPTALSRSGVIGVAGNAGKAEVLYHAAQLGGYPRPDDASAARH